jgi:membrane-associated phospholipid phosphatase
MNLPLPARLGLVLAGTLALMLAVYAAGIFLVPVLEPLDQSLLAAFNPDAYLPGADEFFRALTDYTNFLIAVPALALLAAAGLLRFLRVPRAWLVRLLALGTLSLAVAAAAGQVMPNSVYTGVNVLLVLGILAACGFATLLVHRGTDADLGRHARVVGLMLLTVVLANLLATNYLKGAIARPRPLNEAHAPWNEQVRTIPDEVVRGRSSFPSGHTSGTFALLTPLFWLARDRRVRAGLLSWGVLQAASRVYTAAHFPSCVVAGALLAFGVGTLVFFLLGGPGLRRDLVARA